MNGTRQRLIFVNRVYWPSTEATAQLLTDLAEGLAERGWEVHVIATGHDETARAGVAIHRTGAGERHGGMLSRMLNFRRFQAAARRRLAELTRPGDVVVAMTDPPLLGAHLAPVVAAAGARLVCWVQDIYPEIASAHFGPVFAPFAAALRRHRDAAWRGAAACVTLGEDMREVLRDHGVEPGRITLIPNWAPRELDAAAPAAAVADCRRAWGVADRFVVAYSGNLGRVHEFGTVIDAAGLLRDHAAVTFVFIGRGARFDEIARLTRRHNLPNVQLRPPEPREHLAAALAAADAHLVTLHPAYARLVFPSKLAGVLATARPVLFIGPPEGEIARLLRREDCGAAFAPGRARELADTILRWQADAAACRDLGARARAAYDSSFTRAAALTRWDDCLHRAAGGS